MTSHISQEEKEIIKRFRDNVYGKKPDVSGSNKRHDGKEGHWLERQMGITANANQEADLLGYEMKNNTKSKTTFGDWSADYYIFKSKNNRESEISRGDFIKIFGKPNELKGGRYSWSGSPIPTMNRPSQYNGSVMLLDENHDISIIYNYSNDPRPDKAQIVPIQLQKDNLLLAKWSKANLQTKLHNKFGQKGWFKCSKNAEGEYCEIAFGEPITYDNWIELIRKGVVFFDSGMYEGNARNYSQWRANNNHWNSLITRIYPPFPDELD